MNSKRDGHVHSHYCPHGSNDSFEEYLTKAIELGIEEITFTEHMTMPEGLVLYGIDKEFLSSAAPNIEEMKKYLKEASYYKEKYKDKIKINVGLEVDYLECNSTNCGNNITFLLELLKQNNISFNSILLAQDSTMQHRMEAGLRKYINDNITIINYAVYSAKVIVKNSKLAFEDEILGMWDMDRYITLLMGEIPRLADNEDGYGPRGKGFIAHVDIPNEVEEAFLELKEVYSGMVREANPLYASVN